MNVFLILSGYLGRAFCVDTCKCKLSELCNSCAKIACCSSELIFHIFMHVTASKMLYSNSSGVSASVSFF
jgi:hypothetical protein